MTPAGSLPKQTVVSVATDSPIVPGSVMLKTLTFMVAIQYILEH